VIFDSLIKKANCPKSISLFQFSDMLQQLQLRVGIVGAGLGGLAAAISIARAGHKVTVLEQASALGEVDTDRVHGSVLLTLKP
jgi:ribulose 1,5-bisphosphate synthetase/thiazole synthase